jgi:hypothetical protein
MICLALGLDSEKISRYTPIFLSILEVNMQKHSAKAV